MRGAKAVRLGNRELLELGIYREFTRMVADKELTILALSAISAINS
jgi:hypothetical protein